MICCGSQGCLCVVFWTSVYRGFLVFVAGENWWNIGQLKRLFGSGFFVLDLRFWKAAS